MEGQPQPSPSPREGQGVTPAPMQYLGRVSDVLGAAGQLLPVLAAVAAGGRQLPAQLHKLLCGQEVSRQVVLDVLFKPATATERHCKGAVSRCTAAQGGITVNPRGSALLHRS